MKQTATFPKTIYEKGIKEAIDIENLSSDAIDTAPIDYDFASGYAEEWDVAFGQTDEELENEEWFPMMNYYYPLPYFDLGKYTDEEIKERLDMAGSITLIQFEDTGNYALALTGGGMDLSWDICRAFILLGYLPPIHFYRLPDFAGMDYDRPINAMVLKACHRGIEIRETWNKGNKADLLRIAPEPTETVFQL